MRLSANLPQKLWREIVSTATYLYNRTSRASNDWKSPYKAFHSYVFDKEEVFGSRKPHLHHLRAFGCKTYVLIKSKGDPQYRQKRRKLDAKAHIGFFVGYESTNINRIWVPNKKRVVSVRDVIFNEDEVWDGLPLQRKADEIKELDEAIQVIELPQADKLEDIQLSEDLEVESEITHQTDHQEEDLEADNIAVENDTDKLAEEEDQEWAQNQYPTPDSSVLEAFLANLASMLVDNLGRQHAYDTIANRDKADRCESEGVEPARLDQLDKQQKQRFYDFAQYRIPSNLQNAFTAGSRMVQRRDLPTEPFNYRELKGHPFEERFRTDMEVHIQQQRQQFRSWESLSSVNAKGHQVLGCQ